MLITIRRRGLWRLVKVDASEWPIHGYFPLMDRLVVVFDGDIDEHILVKDKGSGCVLCLVL